MNKQNIDDQDIVQQHFDELLKLAVRSRLPDQEALIRKAFELAREAHKPMRRKSGEPYIIHPIEVAKIVASEIGLGTKSIVSALLHDVVEDTDYTVEDIRHLFGDKVASIVEGLTKISEIYDSDSSLQAENFRKMLLTLSDDVRVILIKLADRLHNMRTLSSMAPNKQLKIAGETLFLYAPMAHRLGLYAIKTELEDLSFKYRHSDIYEEIKIKVNATEKHRTALINKFSLPIIANLTEAGYDFAVSGRPKSIYSIWNKMETKNVPFEEVYDLFAIRIVFVPKPEIPEKSQCWEIYSRITDIYMPKPDRIRDWVSTPKSNGYEALHVTVMGPYGEWVEVQIRTKRMDEIAERGYAAHFLYKGTEQQESEVDKWLRRIREMLENPRSDALEFIDEFKLNLFSSEIIVFTPQGHLKNLPKNATALDFAYEIHSEIGNHAIGAKVNHKLVSLNSILKSGDQVEIITSEKQQPLLEWMEFAVTAKAKTKIKEAFKEVRRAIVARGKTNLEELLSEMQLRPRSDIFKKLFQHFQVSSKDELYNIFGNQDIDSEELGKILKKKTQNKLIRYWKLTFSRPGRKRDTIPEPAPMLIDKKKTLVIDDHLDQSIFKIAECCNPIPGDDVMGYRKSDTQIIIHKTSCPNAIKLSSSFGEHILKTQWTQQKVMSFLARIRLSGIDQIGVVSKVTSIISEELNVNMRAVNFESHDGIFEGTIDLYVHSVADLNNLIGNLTKIKALKSVSRIDVNEEA